MGDGETRPSFFLPGRSFPYNQVTRVSIELEIDGTWYDIMVVYQ